VELRGLSAQCSSVEFSAGGQLLATLAQNWEVGVWDVARNRLEYLFEAPQGISAENAALAFSRDNRQLAFATSENDEREEHAVGKGTVIDIVGGKRVLRTKSLKEATFQDVAFFPSVTGIECLSRIRRFPQLSEGGEWLVIDKG
jgi:hypothetical protein